RKRLSKIKGGKAGYLARRSRTVALYVSDVNPGDLRTIASNPLLPEAAGSEDPLGVLARHQLAERLPSRAIEVLKRANEQAVAEKWDFQKGFTGLLLEDNRTALEAAAGAAAARGFAAEVCPDLIEGDYKQVARQMTERLSELRSRTAGPVCVISRGRVACAALCD